MRVEATCEKQQSEMREGREAWLMLCGQDTSPRRSRPHFFLYKGEKKLLDLVTGVGFLLHAAKQQS